MTRGKNNDVSYERNTPMLDAGIESLAHGALFTYGLQDN